MQACALQDGQQMLTYTMQGFASAVVAQTVIAAPCLGLWLLPGKYLKSSGHHAARVRLVDHPTNCI